MLIGFFILKTIDRPSKKGINDFNNGIKLLKTSLNSKSADKYAKFRVFFEKRSFISII